MRGLTVINVPGRIDGGVTSAGRAGMEPGARAAELNDENDATKAYGRGDFMLGGYMGVRPD